MTSRKDTVKAIRTLLFIFVIGLIIGAQWYRLFLFPFPQMSEWAWNDKEKPYIYSSNELVITVYKQKIPVFADRLYSDLIGDNRLEGLYLVQIPRHYSDTIRIQSSKDLIIYRAIPENGYYDNWELTDIPINIKGQSTTHTKIIKKLFPANNLIELSPGGGIASDPIFIKVKDYVSPALKFKVF